MQKYSLAELYYVKLDSIFIIEETKDGIRYKNIFDGVYYPTDINAVKLKNLIDENGLEILITNENGIVKDVLTKDEIIYLIEVLKSKENNSNELRIKEIRRKLLDYILSVLGILPEQELVALKASQLEKFKEDLSKSIETLLRFKGTISVNGVNDPIILKALRKSSIIKENLNSNLFISADIKGNVTTQKPVEKKQGPDFVKLLRKQ